MAECSTYVSEYLLYPVVLLDILVEVHILEHSECRDIIVLEFVTKNGKLILVAYELVWRTGLDSISIGHLLLSPVCVVAYRNLT